MSSGHNFLTGKVLRKKLQRVLQKVCLPPLSTARTAACHQIMSSRVKHHLKSDAVEKTPHLNFFFRLCPEETVNISVPSFIKEPLLACDVRAEMRRGCSQKCACGRALLHMGLYTKVKLKYIYEGGGSSEARTHIHTLRASISFFWK